MNKFLAVVFAVLVMSAVFLVGCGDEDKLKGKVVSDYDVNATTDEAGRIKKQYLDEDNRYCEYSEDDELRLYPTAEYECDANGVIKEKTFNVYNKDKKLTRCEHYVGKIFDYTEIYEYDKKGNTTKIISYAGAEKRENLVQTLVIEYDKHGNEIKAKTYDDSNALNNYEIKKYVKIKGEYLLKTDNIYTPEDELTDSTKYTYRKDGTTSKCVEVFYYDGEVDYKSVTTFDKTGTAYEYKYYDADGNEIEEPTYE